MIEENKENQTVKKKVDDSWKEQARREKSELDKKLEAEKRKETEFLPPPDLATFVSTTALQALIALGQMENPLTKKKETDIIQAKYNIDLLQMLKTKTAGNLTPSEAQHLDQTLYSLQMLFVKASEGGRK